MNIWLGGRISYAAVGKAAYVGSNPTSASIYLYRKLLQHDMRVLVNLGFAGLV